MRMKKMYSRLTQKTIGPDLVPLVPFTLLAAHTEDHRS